MTSWFGVAHMMRGVAYPAETRPLTRRRRCQWPSPPCGGPGGYGATSSQLAVALTGRRHAEPAGVLTPRHHPAGGAT